MRRPILLIDNFDSFTFNLVDALERAGANVRVLRNTISAGTAVARAELDGAAIMISPGPGGPREAGCSMEVIASAKGRIPLIGICLGHQAIVAEAGGLVERAPAPVHGKSCKLEHQGMGAFSGLPNPLKVGRYHSLTTRNFPPRLKVDATSDGLVMAVSDADAKQVGLQFHPESILTPRGDRIIANLLAWC
ncbi:MAG: anthranilate synthase component II [Allosphingosinicella sp.]|uniref:anthranilate synthase component II n=1 Tax=Allosphingosinicella sp. TaxID=2823234 RepID=UPI00392BD1CE